MESKEIEKALKSIVRLNSNDVCELAMEFLDLNNPDPDRVGDIAERMGMGWDESTEEFLDLENCQLRFHHRNEIYAKSSEILNLKERIKALEDGLFKLLTALSDKTVSIEDTKFACDAAVQLLTSKQL